MTHQTRQGDRGIQGRPGMTNREQSERWIPRLPRIQRRNDRGGLDMNDGTTVEGKTVLITGANRGIGEALVAEALRRGASRVFAGMRRPTPAADSRVTPVKLDVTDRDQIRSAAASVTALDVLVNNAGVMLYDDLSDAAALEQQLAVNLYGPLAVTNAFLPQLVESQGTIVNNVSMEAFAPVPVHPSYAISKAAAFNMTQSLRALLAAKGV